MHQIVLRLLTLPTEVWCGKLNKTLQDMSIMYGSFFQTSKHINYLAFGLIKNPQLIYFISLGSQAGSFFGS